MTKIKIKILTATSEMGGAGWFSFKVENMPRYVHMEMNRHRTFSVTAQSSRFTLSKILKERKYKTGGVINPHTLGNLIQQGPNYDINQYALYHLAELGTVLSADNMTNDMVKAMLPEGLLMTAVYTVSYSDFKHFHKLRTSKTALREIRVLAKAIKAALKVYDGEIVRATPIDTCNIALSSCYLTEPKQTDDSIISYIRRIGVSNKHSSVLEHLNFIMPSEPFEGVRITDLSEDWAKPLKYIRYYNGEAVINLRIVLDILNTNYDGPIKNQILSYLPKSYRRILGVE